MSKITAAENIENLKRTIAATEANIVVKTNELADLKAANFANRAELARAERAERELHTDKARWNRAAKAIRKDGVKFLSNVSACCRGCIDNDKLGLPADDTTTAYGYTFGGQGGRIVWDERTGKATQKSDSYRRGMVAAESANINHGNGSGEKIAAAFRAEGFEVEWDGSEHQTVIVKF